MPALFRRVDETGRRPVRLIVDGHEIDALEGDTLLTALLTNGHRLRQNEFDGKPRAGFCLMGACQDCWLWTETGEELRACSTEVREGMRIVTQEVPWLNP
jgi:D-hydroxyproline dehydrogenase subunit gamma